MTAPLRILMTLDAVGGVWRYALDLARALRPLGMDVAFLGFGPPPGPARRAEAEALGPLDWADAPLDWLAKSAADLAPVPGAVAAAAARRGADLIHLNLPSQAAGLQAGLPVVAVSHSCVSTWFRAVRGTGLPCGWEWHGQMDAEGLARAGAVVAPSRAHADALVACYGPVAGLRVVHNAIAALEADAAGQPFVVASGRWWDEGKGGATLDAAAGLCRWPVRLLGPAEGLNGTAFAPLHATLAGELPHAEAVALVQDAGIFASPSLYEPFGLAVAEAARAGLPLVLSDIPTFRELWDGAAAFVPPQDAVALAETINRLAAQPHDRARLGRAARARAARFAPEAQARTMAALYAELAGAGRLPLLAAG